MARVMELGSWLTMPAKMMSEMPLPTFCSLISSPSHRAIMEPALMTSTFVIMPKRVGRFMAPCEMRRFRKP